MKTIFQVLHEQIHAPSVTSKQRQEALSQAQKLPEQFIRAACMTSTKKELAQLVRSSQLNASLLLNQLHEHQPATTAAWHKTLESTLTAFLHLLRKKFNRHFDDRQPMPEALWIPAKEKIRAGLDNLVTNGEAAEQLVQCLTAEFAMGIKNAPLSFAQANYWTYLLEMLNDPPKTDDIHASYIHLLITHNFNSSLFVHHVLKCYAKDPAAADDATAHWANSYCQVNRMHTHTLPGEGLYKNCHSCKEMLTAAIVTELYAQDNRNQQLPESASIDFIQTTLSVSQLAVFLRLFIDLAIIKMVNIRFLIKKVAWVFRTTRTKAPLSVQNLYDKFYKLEPAAVAIVHAILVNMMARLKKY